MLDLVYTDADHAEQGVLDGYVMTMTYGDVDNSFEVVFGTPSAPPISGGCLLYVEGGEYGGVVRRKKTRTQDGTTRFIGPTWHGVLNEHVVCPPAGHTHLVLSCEANEALRRIVAAVGMEETFGVDTADSGIQVNAEIRYSRAYDAICAMLARAGARLVVSWERDHVELSAVRATTHDSMNSGNADFSIESCFRPTNHLVLLGKGEYLERATADVYADDSGSVSAEQSLFGIDEVTDIYEDTNADADELMEKGLARISDMQDTDEVDVESELVDDYAVGDRVTVTNLEAGQAATAFVTSKTVTISNGEASFSCEIGSASALFDLERGSES